MSLSQVWRRQQLYENVSRRSLNMSDLEKWGQTNLLNQIQASHN